MFLIRVRIFVQPRLYNIFKPVGWKSIFYQEIGMKIGNASCFQTLAVQSNLYGHCLLRIYSIFQGRFSLKFSSSPQLLIARGRYKIFN